MHPNRARQIVRGWPFKTGQSELKRILSLFLCQEVGPIDIVPGLKLHVTSYRREGRLFWWFEEIEAALQFYVARFLSCEGNVVDVGANSGLLGLWAARHKSCQVVLIDASDRAQAWIEKTLTLNPMLWELCTLVKAACSDSHDPRFPDQRVIRLDQLFREKGWDHVDLIKIDTDGHEYEVLRSLGTRLSSAHIDAFYIEMSGKETHMFDVLKRSGFAAYGVRRTHLPELRKLGRNEVERYWFYRVDEPIVDSSPFENFLWVAAGGHTRKHLERWCDPFNTRLGLERHSQ